MSQVEETLGLKKGNISGVLKWRQKRHMGTYGDILNKLLAKGVIMENILNGLYNLLNFIETNWGMIVAIVVLIISIGKKIVSFFGKSQEEQLAIAKAQISETMLKWVTEAEKDYRLWISAGAIKRSQVIDRIFDKYPILSKVTNQEEIIAWLDESINEALKTMRKIFEENKATDNEETN